MWSNDHALDRIWIILILNLIINAFLESIFEDISVAR